MTTQMTIFFETPETRLQFLRDIEGLVVYHDQENRDKSDRMNYEDSLSFYMPDLDASNGAPLNDPCSRMTLVHAGKAAAPSCYCHFVAREV